MRAAELMGILGNSDAKISSGSVTLLKGSRPLRGGYDLSGAIGDLVLALALAMDRKDARFELFAHGGDIDPTHAIAMSDAVSRNTQTPAP